MNKELHEKVKLKRPLWLNVIYRTLSLPFLICIWIIYLNLQVFMNAYLFIRYGGIVDLYEKYDIRTNNHLLGVIYKELTDIKNTLKS